MGDKLSGCRHERLSIYQRTIIPELTPATEISNRRNTAKNFISGIRTDFPRTVLHEKFCVK